MLFLRSVLDSRSPNKPSRGGYSRDLNCLLPELCVRQLALKKWETHWCIVPNKGYEKRSLQGFSVPLFSKRRVPESMMPNISDGETQPIVLDGRWWEAIRQVPTALARVPFQRMPETGLRPAFAYRSGDCVYIALPEASANSS